MILRTTLAATLIALGATALHAQSSVTPETPTVEQTTKPTNPNSVPVPPVPPTPPVPPVLPVPPVPPDPSEIGDEQEVVIDAADMNAARVEAMKALEEARANQEQARVDQKEARAKQRELREASRELRQKMRELSRDFKTKMKDLKNFQIDISLDSSDVANMARTIQMSLDSARTSLQFLDSTISFARYGDSFGLMVFADSSDDAPHGRYTVNVTRDSGATEQGGTFRRHTVFVRSGDGNMTTTNTVIIKTNDDDSLGEMGDMPQFDAVGRSMLIVNGDTTLLPTSHRRFVQIVTDSSSDGGNRQVIVTSRTTDSVSTCKKVMILSGDVAKKKLMESDPKLVAGANTNVVIISKSKGRRVRGEKKEEAAPSAEKPSTRTTANVAGYALEKATPNPVRDAVTIGYTIAQPGHTSLTIFDGNGKTVKTVRNEEMEPGTYTESVDVSGLPSGLYLYQLVSGGYSQTNTFTVVK